MTVNDSLRAFASVSNVSPGQILVSVTPPAGYHKVDCYNTITGTGPTSADSFNVALFVGGVQKDVLMNVQSAQGTSPLPQTSYVTTDGTQAVDLRVIGAPGATTVVYTVNLKTTRQGMG